MKDQESETSFPRVTQIVTKVYEINTEMRVLPLCRIVSDVYSLALTSSGEIRSSKSKITEVIYEVPMEMESLKVKGRKNSHQIRIIKEFSDGGDESGSNVDSAKKSNLCSNSQRLSILPCESINIMNAVYLPKLQDL